MKYVTQNFKMNIDITKLQIFVKSFKSILNLPNTVCLLIAQDSHNMESIQIINKNHYEMKQLGPVEKHNLNA